MARLTICSPPARKISTLMKGYLASKPAASAFESSIRMELQNTTLPSFFAPRINSSSDCAHAQEAVRKKTNSRTNPLSRAVFIFDGFRKGPPLTRLFDLFCDSRTVGTFDGFYTQGISDLLECLIWASSFSADIGKSLLRSPAVPATRVAPPETC